MTRNSQGGSVLVFSTFLMVMLLGLSAPGLRRSLAGSQIATLATSHDRAFQLAAAGLDQAITNLRTIDAADDVYAASIQEGSFVIQAPLVVLEPLVYQINATGTSGGLQHAIEAVVRVTPLPLFRFAMFGDEGITIEGFAKIDSYDSRAGPYDPVTNANGNGNVGTNSNEMGAIDFNGLDLYVDGQLSVGPNVASPESIVDGFNPSLISGDPPVISQPEYPLPGVTIPEGLTCSNLNIEGTVVVTLTSPGVYCYDNLVVKGGATLTSDGPVTIFLEDILRLEGDSTIGVVNDPTQFLFLMASGSEARIGTFAGAAEIYGAIYGPDAEFHLTGDSTLYGSVIGDIVTMSGDAELHYDEALADNNSLSNEGVIELLSWRDDE